MHKSAEMTLEDLLEPGNTEYGLSALVAECKELEGTKKGNRNAQLNLAACKLGSLIASDQLTRDFVEYNLMRACHLNGLINDDGHDSVEATIRSGLKKGLANPRYPEENTRNETTERSLVPDGRKLNIRKASDIKAERVSWLWEGVLAKGAISLLAGNPGLGKSQVSLSVAAIVSSGGYWPVSQTRAEVGNVLILSMEDRAEDTIVPRLKACGADLDRVHILTTVEDDKGERQFNLERDIPLMRDHIEQIGSVSLIIIDPITAYLGKADANSSGEVRGITTELTAMAQEFNASVLMVSHLNKNADKQAAYRVLGSVSWVGAARTAFLIEKDGEDGRLMAPAKNNLAVDTTTFAFSVQPKTLTDGIETSYVVWETNSQNATADQVLISKGDGGDALHEAKDFVAELLKNGPVGATFANKAANDNHISESTLKRAKRLLGVGGVMKNDAWYWAYKGEAA